MESLAADCIATPAVIATQSGERVAEIKAPNGEVRNCTLLAWLDGNLFDDLGRVEKGVVVELKSRYRQLGALAARLHNQGESWQPPSQFERHAWDSEGLLGDDPLWGKFWQHPLLSDAQRKLVLKARLVLQLLLKQLGQGSDCYGLIHADFLPENILLEDGNLSLIDFDDCGYGWYLFEMATSLFPKISEPYFDDLQQSYVDGYRSERELSAEDVEIFPAFLLLRGLTYLGWLMTRAEGLKNRDKIAQEIIDGLCEHIPDLLDTLSPVQRLGVNIIALWRGYR